MTRGTGEQLDRQALIEALLEQHSDLRFAIVFGSRARGGTGRPDSDLDLAVDVGRKLSLNERATMSGELERVAGCPVDLVDLWQAGPILAMQILKKGEVLLAPKRLALAEFRMLTPARYEDWKRMVRPVERAILQRFSR